MILSYQFKQITNTLFLHYELDICLLEQYEYHSLWDIISGSYQSLEWRHEQFTIDYLLVVDSSNGKPASQAAKDFGLQSHVSRTVLCTGILKYTHIVC